MSSVLSDAIREANARGRLGLTIYTVPGYPNPEQYRKILTYLDGLPEVSIIENTFPVRSAFSQYANEIIQNAHICASGHFPDDLPAELLKSETPVLSVLYQETVERYGFEETLRKYGPLLAGLVLEWEAENVAEMIAVANRYGTEFIREVDPQMERGEIVDMLKTVRENGHIYFVTAARTGADLFPASSIGACAKFVKELRPDVTLSAGFGVKTEADVEQIAQIEDMDGVIIGTAAIRAMAGGVDGLKTYLAGILPALSARSEACANVG